MNIREVEQDATKKQNGRVEGNLAVGGGTFGVRLCDQHEAMAGITSSSDMYLLLIMICNRQRCASLYSTVEGLTTSLTSDLGSAIAMWTLRRLPVMAVCKPQTSSVLQIRVAYKRLIQANSRESRHKTTSQPYC
jgi:hypothetical protein